MTRSFGFPKDAYIKTYFRGFYFDPVSRIWKGLDPFPLADCQPGTDNAAELYLTTQHLNLYFCQWMHFYFEFIGFVSY